MFQEGDKVRLRFVKRNKMLWLHRLYGSPLVVEETRGNLISFLGVPEQHNWWRYGRFEHYE